MADLIDRQAAIDALAEECYHDVEDYRTAVRVVGNLPSAESKVVRCKDCKHLFDGEHNVNCCELLMRKAKWLTEITVDMNWYCADGERITDE